MKFFIIASLIAFVAAEAESDPAHLYAIHHGGTHMTNGFVQYSNGAVVPQDTASVMAAKGAHLNAKAMVHPYHILKAVVPTVKATPEMTETKKVVTYATPSYPFYSGYPHVAPYTAYPYATPLTTGVAPVYTTPLTHVQAPYHHLIKREAEAEAEADPALVYHHGGAHLTTHNYPYGHHVAYPYGYPANMGYTAYPAVPYKYPTTQYTYPTYPYTVVEGPQTGPLTPLVGNLVQTPKFKTTYTGISPIYSAPLTKTYTPASTTKLVQPVAPLLAPKLF